VYIGYQVFGDGAFDLVVAPGALSNIEYGWEFESWRRLYGALGSFARVILFDKRGTGISDPVLGAPSLEERMDDVRAVMDAAGSERAALQLRDDISDLRERLDESERTAMEYPHRAKYLLLAVDFLRRLLDLHEQLVDDVERIATQGASLRSRRDRA
jgi:hypothetical protein